MSELLPEFQRKAKGPEPLGCPGLLYFGCIGYLQFNTATQKSQMNFSQEIF
jgi:hypothetical protein